MVDNVANKQAQPVATLQTKARETAKTGQSQNAAQGQSQVKQVQAATGGNNPATVNHVGKGNEAVKSPEAARLKAAGQATRTSQTGQAEQAKSSQQAGKGEETKERARTGQTAAQEVQEKVKPQAGGQNGRAYGANQNAQVGSLVDKTL